MTHELGPLPARWYSVSNDGLATRCHDEEDARYNATQNDLAWPRGAPHRAVQLVEVAEVARAVAAERAKHAGLLEALREYFATSDAAWTEICQEASKHGIKSIPVLPLQAKALDQFNALRRDFAQAHGQTPGSQG